MANFYQRRYYPAPAWWDDCEEGGVGFYPVIGGYDEYEEPLYVGRAIYEDATIPGKVVPRKGCCYVTHGKKVYSYRSYQTLNAPPEQCKVEWVTSFGDSMPPGAVQGGLESDGSPLYIGRCILDDKSTGTQLVVGKVHPRHNVITISTNTSGTILPGFQVLVIQDVKRQAKPL